VLAALASHDQPVLWFRDAAKSLEAVDAGTVKRLDTNSAFSAPQANEHPQPTLSK